MNILFWIGYYFKCALNIIFSYIFSLFRTVQEKNQKFSSGQSKINDYLYIVNLEGSYYDMGLQYGKLMKEILEKDIKIILNFIQNNKDVFFKKINPIIKNELKNDNILDACYFMYTRCSDFIPPEIDQYYKGVSEGSCIDLKKIIQCNYFFELMESHCILYTHRTHNNFLNLRTLDLGCPVLTQNIVVFKPINKNKYLLLGHCFVLGSATMLSEKGLILGESFYDYNLGKDIRKGIPFYILFHKICANANNILEAENIMNNSQRIGNLHISINDFKNKKGKIYKYSHNKLEIDQELSIENNIIYSVTPKEKRKFEKYKNDFTNAEEAISNLLPMVKSGELHVMICCNEYIYISVTSNIVQSYNNQFYKFNINKLFN